MRLTHAKQNQAKVTKERILLIYALMTERGIDVGEVIWNSMSKMAISGKKGIGFPGLITNLAESHLVPFKADDTPSTEGVHISLRTIRLMKDCKGELEEGDTHSSSGESNPEEGITDEVAKIRKDQRKLANKVDMMATSTMDYLMEIRTTLNKLTGRQLVEPPSKEKARE